MRFFMFRELKLVFFFLKRMYNIEKIDGYVLIS